MCGIVGVFRFDKKNVSNELLEKQLNLINHRGPDGRGIYIDKNIGLGHVRLSIVDTSEAGAQPMLSRSGEFALSYNGETYNYKKLKETLNKSINFNSSTDTEVILHGLIQKKESFLKQMEGMFAFSFYDKVRNEITLARDPFGIKPLYYHKNSNRIIFSSEIKPLLAAPDVIAEADQEAIKEHLILGYALEPKTAFKNIFKLSAGHLMTINKRGIDIKRFFDINDLIKKKKNKSFKTLFNKSVLSHTMSDVPLGMFLSGGFDSNIILQSLFRQNKISQKFKAYNVGSSENKGESLFSERNIAKLSAKKFDTNLVEIDIENHKFISFEDIIKIVEEPVCNPSNILIDYITKLAKKHGNKALLTGHGGDEVFAGYRRHIAIKYLKYLNNFIGKFILKKIKKKIGSNLYYKLSKSLSNNTSPYFDLITIGGEAMSNYRCIKSSFINQKDVMKIRNKIDGLISPFKKYSRLKRMMILDLKTYLVAQNLINMDKFSMKNSIEVRVPFLYKPLVALGLSQNDKNLIKRGKTKIMIRNYAKDTLPKEIHDIKKSGFGPSLVDLIESQEAKDILFSDITENRGLLDPDKIRTFINKRDGFTESDAMVVLNYIYIEQWFRTFID